jgi:hypothetical protein
MDIYQATDAAFGKFKQVPGKIDTSTALNAVDDYLASTGSVRVTPTTNTQTVSTKTGSTTVSTKNTPKGQEFTKKVTVGRKVPKKPKTITTTTNKEKIGNEEWDHSNSLLSPKQQKVVEELRSDIQNATNLDELHVARKNFSQALYEIKRKDMLTGRAYVGANKLVKDVENSLQMNAKKLGALDDYTEANTLFKQSKEADIVNDAFKAAELPEGGHNWLAFNQKIIKLKEAKAKQLSEPTKKMLRGVQKMLTEANHLYGVRVRELGGLQPIIAIFRGMFNNPIGQQVLLRMGTEQGRALGRATIKAIVNTLQAKTITGGAASEPKEPAQQEEQQ